MSEPGLDDADLLLLLLEWLDDSLEWEGLLDLLLDLDRLDPDWEREWEPTGDSLPDLCRNMTRVITSPRDLDVLFLCTSRRMASSG